MTVSVEIHPHSSTLSMLNEPDASTSYSLSGCVSVSLSSNASFLDGPHVNKVLLRSLTLTFEGQAELLTNETGYSAIRLCRLTRELTPAQPMLLSINDGHETDADSPSSSPCCWNFVFDLAIPGWLPSSSVYGSGMGGPTGTSYALFAEARFTPLEDGQHSRGWSISSICAPFTPRIRSVNAPRKGIEVIRYMVPTVTDDLSPPTMTFRSLQFTVKPRSDLRPKIPPEVFSKIELRASVPEYVDMAAAGSFTLTLRIRTADLPVEQQQRLLVSQFRLNLVQYEAYSRRPFSSFISTFPLTSTQPHSEPLLHPHAMKGLFDVGITSINFPDGLASRIRASFPILKGKQSQRYVLRNGGISLAQPDADLSSEQIWTRVDVCVPFERILPGQDRAWEHKHGRFKALRADEESPFLRVSHDLEVEVTFAYHDSAEKTTITDAPLSERMCFNIPVRFARVSSAVKSQDVQALPAYSQIFHSNGERRTDNSAPLPAYSPRDGTAASPPSQSIDNLKC